MNVRELLPFVRPAAVGLAWSLLLLPSPALAKRDVPILLEISALEDRRSPGDGRLVQLLTDDNAETRAAAARALGRIGVPDGVPALLDRLQDSDETVRREAIFALGQIGNADARDPLARLAGSNAEAAERGAAVLALGKLDGEGAAEAILPFIGDASPQVRADAAVALARTGDKVAAIDLKPLLTDTDAHVRELAAWAAGRLECLDLLAEVRALLKDADPTVQLAAVKAAGQLADVDAIPSLQLMVRHPDWRVRAGVASALGATQVLEALPGLTLLSQDANVHVRAAVAAALKDIPSHYKKDDCLIPMIRDPEPEVRAATTQALAVGQENRKTSMTEHFTMMSDSSSYVVNATYESFADASRRMERGLPLYQWRGGVSFYMNGRLQNDTAPLTEKISAAYHLGAFDAAMPWPRNTLLDVLSQVHWAVTAAAIHGLSEMTPSVEEDRVRHQAETPNVFDQVLDRDEEANTQVDIRLAIAEGIGSFDNEDARGVARRLLDDPDVRVRQAAAESLEKMGEPKPEVAPAGPLAGEAEPLDDVYLKSRPGRFTAIVTTDRGVIEMELLHQEAPRTVQNFVNLAEKGFFDGLTFHRVVPNFVIQGGCPLGNGWGNPGYDIRCEYSPLPFERGMVGMAHAGKDTGGSQWFVTHSPQRHLDGRYTIFAKVTDGMHVVDEIRVEDRIQSIEIKKKLF
ncbi:MAG: hypothetical protein DHS20C21_06760 [Gemmatimonadota bacterium]|nr:MAG: hypothetical protein DHS20C21_06760 [Gemmatimonadota bacterium]